MQDRIVMNVSQQLMAYSSAGGSGAYIFRPQERMPRQLYTTAVALEVVKVAIACLLFMIYCLLFQGQIVTEVRQRFTEWASQTVRVYADKPFVEIDWLVGPLSPK
jgi:hypothetical protein